MCCEKTDIENLINGLSLLRSHLVTVGHVRTMASVSHCTRKTAMCAFARKVSREKIARKVWMMYNASGGIDTQLTTGFVLSIFGVISRSLLRVLLKISVNTVNDLNPGDIS